MPAELLRDMETLGAGLEDQRALQIALELTKLGLNENDSSTSNSSPTTSQTNAFDSEAQAAMMRKSANMTECVPVPSSEHVAEIVGRQGCKIKALRAKTNTYIKTPVRGEEPVFVVTGRKEDVCSAKHEILSAAEHFSQIRASRRNNNTTVPGVVPGPTNATLPGQVTIQVRVPYRVVGLVVGPKGATIKRIQQQTHTYIVTPNRDKEPIFEVTGMPDNVDKARQEIESHIAMRTGGMMEGNINNHLNNLNSMGGSMANLNLLRNGKGSQGQPEESHTDFLTNGIDAGFHEISSNMLLSSMYNKSPNGTSAFTPYTKTHHNNQSNNMLSQHHVSPHGGLRNPDGHPGHMFTLPPHLDTTTAPPKFLDMTGNEAANSHGSGGIYDSDEGIGGSPTFDGAALQLTSASIWSDLHAESQGSEFGLFNSMNSASSSSSLPPQSMGMSSASSSLSLGHLSFNGGPASVGGPDGAVQHYQSSGRSDSCLPTDMACAGRRRDNIAASLVLLQSGRGGPGMTLPGAPHSEGSTSVSSTVSGSTASSIHSGSVSSSPTEPIPGPLVPPPTARNCVLCNEGHIVAALVPCGHNVFCMDCAKKLVQDCGKPCPVCQQIPTQAIRVFS